MITYMRTESVRVADEAIAAVRSYISGHFPAGTLAPRPRKFRARKAAQDAHEAIHPTDCSPSPATGATLLTPDQLPLYDLN